MAIRTDIVITDDLTGETGAQTYTFALGNQRYEIDLVSDEALREALAPFIKVAHKPGRRLPGGRSRRAASSSPYNPSDVRAWATEQGIKVSTRGKISASVLAAYAERDTAPAAKKADGAKKSKAPAKPAQDATAEQAATD